MTSTLPVFTVSSSVVCMPTKSDHREYHDLGPGHSSTFVFHYNSAMQGRFTIGTGTGDIVHPFKNRRLGNYSDDRLESNQSLSRRTAEEGKGASSPGMAPGVHALLHIGGNPMTCDLQTISLSGGNAVMLSGKERLDSQATHTERVILSSIPRRNQSHRRSFTAPSSRVHSTDLRRGRPTGGELCDPFITRLPGYAFSSVWRTGVLAVSESRWHSAPAQTYREGG